MLNRIIRDTAVIVTLIAGVVILAASVFIGSLWPALVVVAVAWLVLAVIVTVRAARRPVSR